MRLITRRSRVRVAHRPLREVAANRAGYYVGGHLQDLLSLTPEGGEVQERPAWIEVDQEVDVAGERLAAGQRSEHADSAHAVFARGVV